MNMNDPSVRLQFTQCLKTVQFNNYLQDAHHIDTAPTNTTTTTTPSKNTTMKHTHKDPQIPYRYDTLQLLFLTTHYDNTKDYVDEFPLYTVPHYITRKKHPGHDNYLYRRWNNPTASHKHTTKKTRTKRLLAKHSTAKDDTSITPTLNTLSTLDTRSSHPTNIDPDTILSITIWNQPMVHYSTECRSDQPPVINHDTPVPVLL